MGDLLGQPERAASIVAELDNELAALKPGEEPQRTVAAWYANSYTSGSGTLMGDIKKSGLGNIAAKLGHTGTARLPLKLWCWRSRTFWSMAVATGISLRRRLSAAREISEGYRELLPGYPMSVMPHCCRLLRYLNDLGWIA
ncbi:MAG: hypothetical protein E5W34_03355 [Mesorhizobium sp.]|nr:MAG: hypothetical protein EOS75_29395 [Mesorhizobium sp.]TIU27346.1 MAG: hypothetical protein E5W34_03355 [Mesorhizobium sp.]